MMMTIAIDARPSPSSEVRLERLKRLSRLMKWISTIFALCLIAATIGHAVALIDPARDFLAPSTLVEVEDYQRSYSDIPFVQRLGLLASMLVFFCILIILTWHLRALFQRFEQLEFFEQKTLSHILAIGACLIACGVFDVLDDMGTSVLATLDLPEGQRLLSLSIDGGELFFLIFGCLFLVFGWIMREAATIEEENKQFI